MESESHTSEPSVSHSEDLCAYFTKELYKYKVVYFNTTLNSWTATLLKGNEYVPNIYYHSEDKVDCEEEFKIALSDWVEITLSLGYHDLLMDLCKKCSDGFKLYDTPKLS